MGVYRLVKLLKKVFKRPIDNPREEQIRALSDGLKQIKRETEQAVSFHFKNSRENLKFAYFFKLADALADYYLQAVVERFQASSTDLLQMMEAVDESRSDRTRVASLLADMAAEAHALGERIQQIKSAVTQENSPTALDCPPPEGDRPMREETSV